VGNETFGTLSVRDLKPNQPDSRYHASRSVKGNEMKSSLPKWNQII
jgi:hypothetical protein